MVLAFGYSRETGTTGRTGFHSFDKRHTLRGGYYRSGIRDGVHFSVPEELEEIALESKRTIEIDEFVPKDQIDELYLSNPYYLVPDGDVGAEAFAVIREAINKQGMVANKKVVFTSREHIIALEPRGKGMLGVTLRYPYEVRKEEEAGYITCDQLLRDHLRNQQQRISDVIVGTVQGKQHQLISFWLGSAKVDNQEDPSEQQAMAA